MADRRGIDNNPPDDILLHMQDAAKGMEQVRKMLGHPIHVNSWYRCPRLNEAVGGVDNSAHTTGYAIDFVCPAYGSILEVCRAVRNSDILFDQLIWEYGRWVHLSFAPTYRMQVLTKRTGEPYRFGLPGDVGNGH